MTDTSSDKNWWERNVEDTFAEAVDQERNKIPEDQKFQRLKHDVSAGILKGGYRAGKSLLSGVVDMAIWQTKTMMGHPDVWKTNWNVAKKLAQEAWIAKMGTPEEIADQNRRAEAAIFEMGSAVADSLKKDWSKAEKEGKRAEQISIWVTQGVIEVASFFIGAGEVKAAARLSKAGKLGKFGEAASVMSKCPIRAKIISKIGKGLNITEAAAEHLIHLAEKHGVRIRMRKTNPDSMKWIEKGHPPKPMAVKSKTINDDDVKYLGVDEKNKGLVGLIDPKKIPNPTDNKNWNKWSKQEQEAALKRFKLREDEFKKAVAEGDIGKKFNVNEEGVVTPKNSDKGYTGDNDPFDISGPNGEKLSDEKYREVVEDMKNGPLNVQHGAHTDWPNQRPGEAKFTPDKGDQKIYDDIVAKHTPGSSASEPLVEVRPDGTTHNVWADGSSAD